MLKKIRFAFLVLIILTQFSCIENREFYNFVKNSINNHQNYKKYLDESKFSTNLYWRNTNKFHDDSLFLDLYYNCTCSQNISYNRGRSGYIPDIYSRGDTLYFITFDCFSKIDCKGNVFEDYSEHFLRARWKLINGVWEYLGIELFGPGQ